MKYVGPLLLALFLCLSLQAQDQEEGFFVAHQCATSASLMIAKQKALLNTKGELATQINGKITSVSQSYLRETDVLDAIRKHVMANERLQKVFKKEKFDELWNE